MTAHRGAGYTSSGGGGGVASRPGTATVPGQAPAAPPDRAAAVRALEAGVHASLEAAATAAAAGETQLALERAQEAARRQRRLARALADATNMSGGAPPEPNASGDLAHATALALAEALAAAGRDADALRAYRRALAAAPDGPAGWRVRVNAGNAHLAAGDVPAALKHYRMALDAVPPDQRALRSRVGANVGAALVTAGRYADAAAAYEAALDDAGVGLAARRRRRLGRDSDGGAGSGSDDDDDLYGEGGHGEEVNAAPPQTTTSSVAATGTLFSSSLSPVSLASAAHNLAVCRYALDDGPGMMAAFRALVAIRAVPDGNGGGGLPPLSATGSADDEDYGGGGGFHAHQLTATLSRFDALAGELAERAAAVDALLLRAARLLAPALGRFLPPLMAQHPHAAAQPTPLFSSAYGGVRGGGGGGGTTTARGQPIGGGRGYGGSAPVTAPQPPLPQWAAGYEWVIGALTAARRPGLAGEVRIVQATALMEVRVRREAGSR
jgi:tetratricopeptide (TPR) repeat protein